MITEFEIDESKSEDEIEQFHAMMDEMRDKKLVVAYFHASWCGPCKALSPMIKSLVENELVDLPVEIVKIDLDEYQDLGKDLRISKLPALVLFSDGEEKQRLFGLKSKEELKKKFLKVLDPSQEDT